MVRPLSPQDGKMGRDTVGLGENFFLKFLAKMYFILIGERKGKHSAAFMKEMKKVSFKLLFRMPN